MKLHLSVVMVSVINKGPVINYREGGGATKQEGGGVKFYSYKKGGGRKKF